MPPLRWLLFVATPFAILIVLPQMVADELGIFEAAFLGGSLVVLILMLGAGRYINSFRPGQTGPLTERDLQSLVLQMLARMRLGWLPLARDLRRLDVAGIVWYSEVGFSRTILLAYFVAFAIYCCAELLGILTNWFGMFLGVAVLLVFHSCARSAVMRRYEKEDAQLTRSLRRTQWIGWWEIFGLLCLTGLAMVWRFHGAQARVIFVTSWTVLSTLILHLVRVREGRTSAFHANIVTAEVAGPLALAWVVSSLPLFAFWGSEILIAWYTHNDGSYAVERVERASRPDRVVAIALSGGGYRAALVHAGILSVLDEARVPISYLSTVSGGSVVGGAYALGWKPADFAESLAVRRPGFANEMFSLLGGLHLWHWDWTVTDTFALHLGRRYFHWHSLDEPLSPRLIVNLTRYADGKREIFWSGQAKGVLLRSAVAASGAFPGAFDPISIQGNLYMDGGIVENLGLEGLRQFLEHPENEQISQPAVLIIADASWVPDVFREERKVFFWESAYRAVDLSRESIHRLLYESYTDRGYNRTGPCPSKQPFWIDASRVWRGRYGPVAVFVLDPTSPVERCRFSGYEEHIALVKDIPSVKELSRTEVAAAYWAGQKIVRAYLDEICRAVGTVCVVKPEPGVPRRLK